MISRPIAISVEIPGSPLSITVEGSINSSTIPQVPLGTPEFDAELGCAVGVRTASRARAVAVDRATRVLRARAVDVALALGVD